MLFFLEPVNIQDTGHEGEVENRHNQSSIARNGVIQKSSQAQAEAGKSGSRK